MSENDEPRDGGTGASDADGVAGEGDDPTPRERAKRLATRLRFLRMRERTANFEDREAIRREIRRTEEELTRLAATDGFEVDVDVRHER